MWYQSKIKLPGEVIYKIVTTEDALSFGITMILLTESRPHFHTHTQEKYVLISGSLIVHIDDECVMLTRPMDEVDIPINTTHWAESFTPETPAQILVITTPAWTKEDHHTVS